MNPIIIPYYVEINVFTFALLLVIYHNINRRQTVFASEVLFNATILTTMIAMGCDTIAVALEGLVFPGAIAINWILDVVYFITSLQIPLMFFGYIRSVVRPESKWKSPIAQLISAPFYIYTVLIITTYWTGLVFTINEQNIYSRGPLRVWHSIIAVFFLIVSIAYVVYFGRKGTIKKEQAFYLITLPMFPMIGVVLRSFAVGSNIIWSATTIGLLICYIQEQNSMIYVDALTGLNNRGRCDQYLLKKLNNLDDNQRLYFVIVDINYFKQINDNFGHAEGDDALKNFAAILKKACKLQGDFVARFGGDEFVFVAVRNKDEDIKETLLCIDYNVEKYNNSSNKDYKITCSYGYTSTTKEEGKSLDRLLMDADEYMYHVKQEFHKNNESILK